MSNIKKVRKIQVVTIFPSGSKVKFNISSEEFINTLMNDNEMRRDMWMEADNDKKYSTYYSVTNLKFDKETLKLSMVELTPIDMVK